MSSPTPPIPIAGGADAATARLGNGTQIPETPLNALAESGVELLTDRASRTEASRDWWPLAMIWATEGSVGAIAEVVARPTTAQQVAEIYRICAPYGVAVTPAGGRSGVLGASVPVGGGVLVDLTAMAGIVSVDVDSGIVEVLPGTFGHDLERELAETYGLTVGHWPQSMTLATVGGWVACRGAGQLSTRYGTIDDLVVGLDVVLPRGELVTLGGYPKASMGGDVMGLFIGSEGTLGTITSIRLRARPAPSHHHKAAYTFDSFEAGLDAMRRAVRRGAQPAAFRLYDHIESERNYQLPDPQCALIVYDEGDEAIVDASAGVVRAEVLATPTAAEADGALVDRWLEHRNDVSALESLIDKGYVVDTMEISAVWSRLDTIYHQAVAAIGAVPGVLVVSAHQSHSYIDGGCLYFTFAALVEADQRDDTYRAIWDAGTRAVLNAGGSLSHHHGVGLGRSGYLPDALGSAYRLLDDIRRTIDPIGIANPGKRPDVDLDEER